MLYHGRRVRMQRGTYDAMRGIVNEREVQRILRPANDQRLAEQRILEEYPQHAAIVVSWAIHRRRPHDRAIEFEQPAERAEWQLA